MLEPLAARESLLFLLPELVLAGGLLLVLLLDMPQRTPGGTMVRASILFSLLAFAASFAVPFEPAVLAGRMFTADPAALFLVRLVTLATAVTLGMAAMVPAIARHRFGEFAALLLSVALGACFMARASDLLTLYLSVEMTSLGSYVLAGFIRRDRRGAEAALKYVLFGALASGLMIYGASLLFALTGRTSFDELHGALSLGNFSRPALLVSTLLLFAGLAYKLSVVPFHSWTPDVYDGAPTPVAAFLSVVPKAAAMLLVLRFFYSVLGIPAGGPWVALSNLDWPLLVAAVAAATMTIGNLAALNQPSVKRMLAWSAVAHAGYLLLGAAALSDAGGRAVLFYLVTYYLMNLGAFLVVLLVEERTGGHDLAQFRGLVQRAPLLAVAMSFFLLSLTGIPLTAGFVGKVYLFAAVVESGLYWLAVIGVVNAAISLYFYARVLRAMTLEPPESPGRLGEPLAGRGLAALLAALTILFGLWWTPLARLAESAFRMN